MTYPLLPLFVTGVLGASPVALGLIEGFAEAIVSVMRGLSGYYSDATGHRVRWVRRGYGITFIGKIFVMVASHWSFVLCGRTLDRVGKGVRGAPRDALIAEPRDELVVSVDSRAGVAAVAGWEESEGVDALGALIALEQRGVAKLIVSDIDVDGTMEGPNLAQIAASGEVLTIPFIYSGGVGSLRDLSAIAAAAPPNLDGVIVGKALYDGAFTIEQARDALNGGV